MTWAGEVVLVAGATSPIGATLCARVAAAGGSVAAAVQRQSEVGALRQAIGSARALVGVVPAADAEAAAGFVKGARDALGAVTTFVGAAARHQPRAAGSEPGGDLAELLAANLITTATLARAVLPSMRRARRGSLVFVVATDAARDGGSAAFAASAAALHAYARVLAADLAGTGVDVHVLALDDVVDAADAALRIERMRRSAHAGEPLSPPSG